MYRSKVNRLEAKVKQQQKLLKLAAQIIKKQKNQLDAVRLFSYNAVRQAENEIQKLEQGGLPKGQYTYKKRYLEGVQWCAGKVYGLVQIDYAAKILEQIAALQGGF